MIKKLEGHLIVGCLNEEEKELVGDMTRNIVPPKSILIILKDRRNESVITIKQVYNVCQKYKKTVRGLRLEMKHLIKCSDDHKYAY